MKEVQQKYPYIQWVEYVNALLPQPLSVDEDEVIAVRAPSYFENLEQLLQETTKRSIANYMIGRLLGFLVRERFTNASWNDCIDITSEK